MQRDEARRRAAERCWAAIGTLGGDRSCPILADCHHCRECVVITVAADDLLAKVEISSARSDTPARAAAPQDRMTFVVFEVAGQGLAVQIEHVVEVGAARPIRRVPHRSNAAFAGLVNVRGRLEPCFRLPPVLGLSASSSAPELAEQLLVLGDDERRCACLVQSVAVQEIDALAIGAPPTTVSAALDSHVRGILRSGARSWSWIDADRLARTLDGSLT